MRICRDVAAKDRFDLMKPGALLSKFLPSLKGPGKMSSSDAAPSILLSDDRDAIFEKMRRHAYSGGRSSVAEHRKHGGNPEVDVSYRLLASFFEEDDERLTKIAESYREGTLLTGELKEIAAGRIADFLEAHQERRSSLGTLADALAPYRMTPDERSNALRRVGYDGSSLVHRPLGERFRRCQ